MFSLAKETNWSEDHILDMPIGRVWTYRHALLRSYNTNTYYKTNNEERKALLELFD